MKQREHERRTEGNLRLAHSEARLHERVAGFGLDEELAHEAEKNHHEDEKSDPADEKKGCRWYTHGIRAEKGEEVNGDVGCCYRRKPGGSDSARGARQ